MLANEFDIVVKSDDFSSSICFDVFLIDSPGLVVEEPMGVSAPSHTSHVYPIRY